MAAVAASVRSVPQDKVYIVEKFGVYHSTWKTGIHVKVPIVYKIVRKVSLKEKTVNFVPQQIVTKDNVTLQFDISVRFSVTDPKLYAYSVEQPFSAVENLTETALRNIIGGLELESTFRSCDVIGTKINSILNEAVSVWGIKVDRVEIDILPIREFQSDVEQRTKTENKKRVNLVKDEF